MAQLVLTSDTLAGTPATGTLEYNGQFFGTDSAAARAQMQRITLATAVASTSGTSIDFTSIPAWVKRITVMFAGVSTTGASDFLIQLGSGSVTTSGYLGASSRFNGSSVATVNGTTGFLFTYGISSSQIMQGNLTLTLLTSNTWTGTGQLSDSWNNATINTAGRIVLSGACDRVRITTLAGTDTFDAGSVNILYEG